MVILWCYVCVHAYEHTESHEQFLKLLTQMVCRPNTNQHSTKIIHKTYLNTLTLLTWWHIHSLQKPTIFKTEWTVYRPQCATAKGYQYPGTFMCLGFLATKTQNSKYIFTQSWYQYEPNLLYQYPIVQTVYFTIFFSTRRNQGKLVDSGGDWLCRENSRVSPPPPQYQLVWL